MQSRLSPDNLQKVSGLGIYQSILKRSVLQICQIGHFSMIERPLPTLVLCIQSWSMKKRLAVFWNSRMLKSRLYWNLYPRKKNSNKVFRRIINHRALSLRITHRTEIYLSLVGKKCCFFWSVLGNISVYPLVIFITLSVLMIFSNLTFQDKSSQESSLSSKSSASSVSRFKNHSSRSETGVKRYSKKPRSFSNEVSSNNAKSPFPGQLEESFLLGNIWIYLKPCSSTNM